MPLRYDVGEYRKPRKMANGFLKADATFTRTGVLSYMNADGSVRKELRLPEEVFASDSLDTLELAPITREHPREPVSTGNVRQVAIGRVGHVRQDEDKVSGSCVLEDSIAIKDVESGKRQEFSCGYWADLESVPGVHDGEHYDAIQRNIRYNHVALTEIGRAGPKVRIHLDSADAVMVKDRRNGTPERGTKTMEKLTLDGIDFQVDNPQLVQAVRQAMTRRDSDLESKDTRIKELEQSLAKAEGRADTAEADVKKAKEDLEQAQDPKALRERLDARLDLERTAKKLLGDDVKIQDMDDLEIKRAVIQKHDTEAQLDDKSEAYLEGRYDSAVAALATESEGNADVVRRAAQNARPSGSSASADFQKDSREAWKQPLNPAAS